MIHFWGAAQIAERLGYRNIKSFYRAYYRGQIPAYRRRDPRNPKRLIWYSSEAMVLLGEMTMAKRQFEANNPIP